MSYISYAEAVREGILEEMRRDENVIVVGEDLGVLGSSNGITRGFLKEFGPHRVVETPISESGFIGMCVGAAMRGIRPVAELMYVDFISVSLDPVMNQAAKLRYMTGGQFTIPLVVRASFGSGRRNAGQHSQSLEGLFAHIPGLKVVCPSCAKDAKGLIKTAIRDNDPVIFLEHKLLYATCDEVPDEDYTIPFGQAEVRRYGLDITIITWSRQVKFAIEAAEILMQEGIDIEVIDLRTLVPLDWDSIMKSVSKTHNVIVLSEEVKRGSYASEIAAQISEELFHELHAPVCRVAGLNVCSPFSPSLEDATFPQVSDIIAAVKDIFKVKC